MQNGSLICGEADVQIDAVRVPRTLAERRNNKHLPVAAIEAVHRRQQPAHPEQFLRHDLPVQAGEDDPALKGKEIYLPAKMAERLLLLEEGHCLREHTLQACKRPDVRKADGMEATSLLTLLQMVESGMGIALLPEIAVNGGLLNGTHLVAKPLAPPAPKRVIALVARASTAHLDEFEAFSNCIQERFQKREKISRSAVKSVAKK